MRSLIILLAVILIGGSVHGESMTFVVDDPGGRNMVKFTSKAPIESIVGVSHAVSGSVTLDPDDLKKNIQASITVDLKTLKTGIDMLDGHMRSEKYLHTEEYPNAVFILDGSVGEDAVSLTEGKPVEILFKGVFTLHGVSKEIEINGTATYLKEVPGLVDMGYPGDMLNFDGSFVINMGDYNIERPQMLMLKLAEEVNIHLNFTATTGR